MNRDAVPSRTAFLIIFTCVFPAITYSVLPTLFQLPLLTQLFEPWHKAVSHVNGIIRWTVLARKQEVLTFSRSVHVSQCKHPDRRVLGLYVLLPLLVSLEATDQFVMDHAQVI